MTDYQHSSIEQEKFIYTAWLTATVDGSGNIQMRIGHATQEIVQRNRIWKNKRNNKENAYKDIIMR